MSFLLKGSSLKAWDPRQAVWPGSDHPSQLALVIDNLNLEITHSISLLPLLHGGRGRGGGINQHTDCMK